MTSTRSAATRATSGPTVRARSVVGAALAFLVAVGTPMASLAVPLAEPEPNVEEQLKYDALMDRARRDPGLGEVVRLLRAGRKADGKLALARHLTLHPADADALELSAIILIQEAKYPPAEEALKRVLALDPTRAGAVAKFGVVMLLQNRTPEGTRALQDALRLDPNEPLALRYMGWLAEQSGAVDLAVSVYERLLGIIAPPGSELNQVHLALARLYNGANRFTYARALLQSFAEPGSASAASPLLHLYLFEADLGVGDEAAAEASLAELTALVPEGQPELLFARASLAEHKGEVDTARALLRRIETEAPDQAAQAIYRQARLSQSSGDPARALDELSRAVDVAPPLQLAFLLREQSAALVSGGRGPEAVANLGRHWDVNSDQPMIGLLLAETQVTLGDTAAALATLDELARRSPDFSRGHYLAAVLHFDQDHADQAVAELRKALDIDPGYIEAWQALVGATHETAGDAAAETVLDEALRVNPDDPRLLFDKGAIDYHDGRLADAEIAYRKVVERFADSPPALSQLAIVLVDRGQHLDEAANLAARAVDLDPSDPLAQDAHGWSLLSTGDPEGARQLLESAVEARPTDGITRYHLARAYRALGLAEEARVAFEKARALGLPEHYGDDAY